VPQLSVAVGGVQVAIADVSVVVKDMFVGHADKTGFVVSVAHGFMTVTVKEHVTLLLLASVAV
jgi:phosphoglycerate dehydrogenase-like enzyme